MKKDYIIRLETEKEYEEVENLEMEAFWNVYRPGAGTLRASFIQKRRRVYKRP